MTKPKDYAWVVVHEAGVAEMRIPLQVGTISVSCFHSSMASALLARKALRQTNPDRNFKIKKIANRVEEFRKFVL